MLSLYDALLCVDKLYDLLLACDTWKIVMKRVQKIGWPRTFTRLLCDIKIQNEKFYKKKSNEITAAVVIILWKRALTMASLEIPIHKCKKKKNANAF